MECIIIAIPNRETSGKIAKLIQRREPGIEIYVGSSPSFVLREANNKEYGIIICTERIKDMSYVELFDYLPKTFEMIVISKRSHMDPMYERIQMLTMPLQTQQLLGLLFERLTCIGKTRKKHTVIRTERTPEEQQVIDQAKTMLMKQKNLTEPEAHRLLQKQSMDYGRSLLESAQMILLLNSEW